MADMLWPTCHHVTSYLLCAKGNISCPAVCYFHVLSATYVTQDLSFWILRVYCSVVCRNQHDFPWCHQREQGFVYESLSRWWMKFFVNFLFGHKYDRACIWNGIIYNFINFRKVWKLESDSFNHEILAGDTVAGAWSSPIVQKGRLLRH